MPRKTSRLAEAERIVAPILEAVRNRGDAALLEYARKFDQLVGWRQRPREHSRRDRAAARLPRSDRRGQRPIFANTPKLQIPRE